MDEKLTLNDGTELTGHFLETETRLFLYIYGKTLDTVFNLLFDPEKTKKITQERFGEKTVVRGYKKLMSVAVENEDMISASMKRG